VKKKTDGFTKSTLLSRSAMPPFNCKEEFKTMPKLSEDA
jgi:hypothetical protein